MRDPKHDLVLCRCEDTSLGEVLSHIKNGGVTGLGELRKVSRVGMGSCQGRACLLVVRTILAKETNQTPEQIPLPRVRAPFLPVALGALARLAMKTRPDNASPLDDE